MYCRSLRELQAVYGYVTYESEENFLVSSPNSEDNAVFTPGTTFRELLMFPTRVAIVSGTVV